MYLHLYSIFIFIHLHPYCDSLIFIVSSNVFPPISLTTGIGLRHTPDESRIRCPGGGTAPTHSTENDALVYIDSGRIPAYKVCMSLFTVGLNQHLRNFITVQIGRCFAEKTTAFGCCRHMQTYHDSTCSLLELQKRWFPFWILFDVLLLVSKCFIFPFVEFILGCYPHPTDAKEMSGLKETVPFEKRAAEAQRILSTWARKGEDLGGITSSTECWLV